MLLGSRNLVICIYLGSIVIASNAFSQEYIPFGVEFENPQKPLPVKVVIVTMFEIGEDVGDRAGEFQLWKERQGLNVQIAFPHSHHDLFYNEDTQVLGIVTGIGTAKSASAIMALGLDSRLDLSNAYWIIAGIAGIDPEDASIGSAVWSSYLRSEEHTSELQSQD